MTSQKQKLFFFLGVLTLIPALVFSEEILPLENMRIGDSFTLNNELAQQDTENSTFQLSGAVLFLTPFFDIPTRVTDLTPGFRLAFSAEPYKNGWSVDGSYFRWESYDARYLFSNFITENEFCFQNVTLTIKKTRNVAETLSLSPFFGTDWMQINDSISIMNQSTGNYLLDPNEYREKRVINDSKIQYIGLIIGTNITKKVNKVFYLTSTLSSSLVGKSAYKDTYVVFPRTVPAFKGNLGILVDVPLGESKELYISGGYEAQYIWFNAFKNFQQKSFALNGLSLEAKLKF